MAKLGDSEIQKHLSGEQEPLPDNPGLLGDWDVVSGAERGIIVEYSGPSGEMQWHIDGRSGSLHFKTVKKAAAFGDSFVLTATDPPLLLMYSNGGLIAKFKKREPS